MSKPFHYFVLVSLIIMINSTGQLGFHIDRMESIFGHALTKSLDVKAHEAGLHSFDMYPFMY